MSFINNFNEEIKIGFAKVKEVKTPSKAWDAARN